MGPITTSSLKTSQVTHFLLRPPSVNHFPKNVSTTLLVRENGLAKPEFPPQPLSWLLVRRVCRSRPPPSEPNYRGPLVEANLSKRIVRVLAPLLRRAGHAHLNVCKINHDVGHRLPLFVFGSFEALSGTRSCWALPIVILALFGRSPGLVASSFFWWCCLPSPSYGWRLLSPSSFGWWSRSLQEIKLNFGSFTELKIQRKTSTSN